MTTIDRIDCYPVVVPLPEPIRVFGNIIREREFVFVRVYAGGYCGTGFGLSRGLPIDHIVRRQVEQKVIGQPLGNQRQIWDACRKSMRMTGEAGAYARALSLVDIALWDAWAQSLSVPLWRLLGGAQANIPCMAICGYYREEDPVGAVRAEAERLLKLGYTRFKIPFGADLRLDIQRLTAIREVIGPDTMLGIDASAAYDTVKEALTAWQAVEHFNLAFFEDPFPAGAIDRVVALTQSMDGRVGFGESVSDLTQLRLLAQNVDLYRPDATYQLGITGYLLTVPLAQAHASWIMPHYYPDLHAPLVGALGGTMVEESPAEADTVNFGALRGEQPRINGGIWQLSESPGLGIVWDEEAIAHYRASTP